MNMTANSDLESIFQRALECEDKRQRESYLQEACGDNRSIRAEIDRLLRSHDIVAGSNVDSPDLRATELINRGTRNESVLGNFHDLIGDAPSVVLNELDAEPEPIQRPDSCEIPSTPQDGRYQLQGEIARGGMGVVIKGRDNDLGRDLAVKVLLESHRDKPEVTQRFIEEAQIGGQLQHPGIAPVYELGQFADQRPYFTMKLVKGKTLAALLAGRKSVDDDRSKFIGIFEQVCQTMAYAHSRGVIHRDLKPANIMVGAFGEVQVMDWGLAKVLSSGGVTDEKLAHQTHQDRSVIETLRSGGSDTPMEFGSQTQMGSVMGTPAYMAPEQALGEIDQLDQRADVFGLGAVLCEVLTGKPPYVADDALQIYRMATRAKLDDCFHRLEDGNADPVQISLTKECLSPEPADRPRDASELASRIAEHQESVETRLRQSEVESAAQAARAESQAQRVEEQRKAARRLRTGLIALTVVAVFALIATGLAITSSQEAKENERLAKQEENKAQRETAKADDLRIQAEIAVQNTERELFLADMSRATLAYEEGNMGQLKAFLYRHRPTKGKPDPGPAWHYWNGVTQRPLAQSFIAWGGWSDAAVHTKQNMIAISNWSQIWVRDTQTFDLIKQIQLEENHPKYAQVAFSPDGTTLVIARDDLVRMDTRTWKTLGSPLSPPKHEIDNSFDANLVAVFEHLTFSPDGAYLAASTRHGQISIWDTQNWHVVRILESRAFTRMSKLQSLLFSPDGRELVVAISNESTQVGVVVSWDTTDLLTSPERTLFDMDSPIHSIAYSPDGRTILSACDSGEIILWNGEDSKASSSFFSGRAPVKHVAFSPQGKYVGASTEEGNSIMIWEWPTGRLVSTLKGQFKVSPFVYLDENRIAATGGEGEANFFDIHTGGAYVEIPETKYAAGLTYFGENRLAWRDLPDNPPNTRGSYDDILGRQASGPAAAIQIYDVQQSKRLPPWMGGEEFTIHATSDNGEFLAAQGSDGRIRLWETQSKKQVGITPPNFELSDDAIGLLTVSNDGKRVFWAKLGEGSIWDTWDLDHMCLWFPSNDHRVCWHGNEIDEEAAGDDVLHFAAVYNTTFSRDSELLAVWGRHADGENLGMIWDVTGSTPRVIDQRNTGQAAISASFSPDNTCLMSGHWGGGIYKHNLSTTESNQSPFSVAAAMDSMRNLAHSNTVTSLAFLPTGQLLSASTDRTLRMSHVIAHNHQPITRLPSNNAVLTRLTVPPSGDWVVASSRRQNARMFNFRSQPRLLGVQAYLTLHGLAGSGQFDLARKMAGQVSKLDCSASQHGIQLGQCAFSLYKNDYSSYEKLRDEMEPHLRNVRFPHTLANAAIASCMRAGTTAQMDAVVEAASALIDRKDERLTAVITLEEAGRLAASLAHYRKGDYEESLVHSREFQMLESPSQQVDAASNAQDDVAGELPPGTDNLKAVRVGESWALAVQAMCHYRQGDHKTAENLLKTAREKMKRFEHQGRYPGSAKVMSEPWWGYWMLEKTIVQEAATLVESTQR